MPDSGEVGWSVEHIYIGGKDTEKEVTTADIIEDEKKTLIENVVEEQTLVLDHPEFDEKEVELSDNIVGGKAATVEEEKTNLSSAPDMDNLAEEHDVTDKTGDAPQIHRFRKQVFDI